MDEDAHPSVDYVPVIQPRATCTAARVDRVLHWYQQGLRIHVATSR